MPADDISEIVIVVDEPFEYLAVDRWKRLIDDAVASRPQRLIVDLRQSPIIDAEAIGVLLTAHRTMTRDGGRLVLRAAPERIRRILRLARLDQVFEFADAARVDS